MPNTNHKTIKLKKKNVNKLFKEKNKEFSFGILKKKQRWIKKKTHNFSGIDQTERRS